MSKSLDNALKDHAWSVSSVIFDLNAMHDDEGRPVSERRADAVARVGVEMEMQKCPFEGIRKDKWMNVSALTQITQYYKDALSEMSAFRRNTRQSDATWDDMLACIVDLLAGPALYLLKQRSAAGPVPARLAVCHKLAAGMFGVLRGMHQQIATGADYPVTAETFMQRVEETGALLGATLEACAGSLPMIRKAVVALVDGTDDNSVDMDPVRLEIARCLGLQVQLGIFWQQYDQVHLWSLTRGEFSEHLVPVNQFLQQKIERTAGELQAHAPQHPDCARLPSALDTGMQQKLSEAFTDTTGVEQLTEDMRIISELLDQPGSVVHYKGAVVPFVLSAANYLNTCHQVKEELSRIELQLREFLGYNEYAPIQLGSAVFPTPQALHWYELIIGRKLGEDGHLSGKSTKIKAAI